jgi:hypothetical protein
VVGRLRAGVALDGKPSVGHFVALDQTCRRRRVWRCSSFGGENCRPLFGGGSVTFGAAATALHEQERRRFAEDQPVSFARARRRVELSTMTCTCGGCGSSGGIGVVTTDDHEHGAKCRERRGAPLIPWSSVSRYRSYRRRLPAFSSPVRQCRAGHFDHLGRLPGCSCGAWGQRNATTGGANEGHGLTGVTTVPALLGVQLTTSRTSARVCSALRASTTMRPADGHDPWCRRHVRLDAEWRHRGRPGRRLYRSVLGYAMMPCQRKPFSRT